MLIPEIILLGEVVVRDLAEFSSKLTVDRIHVKPGPRSWVLLKVRSTG